MSQSVTTLLKAITDGVGAACVILSPKCHRVHAYKAVFGKNEKTRERREAGASEAGNTEVMSENKWGIKT